MKTEWTPELVATAERLYHEKQTPTQIAAIMGGGLTKTAVYKKLYRLGIWKRVRGVPPEMPTPDPVLASDLPPEPDPPVRPEDQPVPKEYPPGYEPPAPEPAPLPEQQPEPTPTSELPKKVAMTLGFTLERLPKTGCRWIIYSPRRRGEDESIFCGAKKLHKSPYCKEHHAQAHYRY